MIIIVIIFIPTGTSRIYTTQRRGSPRYMLLYHILLFSVTGGGRPNDTHLII